MATVAPSGERWGCDVTSIREIDEDFPLVIMKYFDVAPDRLMTRIDMNVTCAVGAPQ